MTEKQNQKTSMNQKSNEAMNENQSINVGQGPYAQPWTEHPEYKSYVDVCLNLTYLFSPKEVRFIIHMLETQHIASLGYNTDWSKNFMMYRINMGATAFNRCEKRLIEMKLIEKRPVGNKVCYTWNVELYERLISIVCASEDVDAVKEFCKTKFIAEKRAIADITDEEIELLKNTAQSGID